MRIAYGTYVGDGASSRGLTGVGFQPHLVIVKGGANVAVFRTATMVTDGVDALPFTGASNIASIQTLDADGFSVNAAANVNANGTTYYYVAVRDNGVGDFAYGKYTGNAVDGRTITGLGFAPNCFVTKRTGTTNSAVFRASPHPTNESTPLNAASNITDGVKSLDADGVTLGTNAATNANTAVYYYFAFKSGTGSFAVGTYMGDGIDDRLISGMLSVRVGFVLVKGNSGSNGDLRTLRFSEDSSGQLNAIAPNANHIQRFLQDGIQIGTNANVNTVATAYYWFALGAPSVVPVIDALIRMRKSA